MENTLRVKAEISLSDIRHNYAALRRHYGEGVKILSVLKADAYGHGVSGIAKTCDELTDYFAVATVEEAERIRTAGGVKPILLFGPAPEGRIADAARIGITFAIPSLEYARTVQQILKAEGLTACAHLKIDTGMNRVGIRWRDGLEAEVMAALEEIYAMDTLQITGIYTHLPVPDNYNDDDDAFTAEQIRLFRAACDALTAKGYDVGLRHCSSTGGSIAHPDYIFDMVRIGMMVYGQCDTLEHTARIGLRESLRWVTSVIQVETLKKGEYVSYGRTFRADKDMVIGTLSCGYADGYRRCYNKNEVLAGGKRVRILGRICMDFMIIDLTDVEDPHVGMEVVLLGSQGEEHVSAIEIAAKNESTCGEVTAAINQRVPRIYTEG